MVNPYYFFFYLFYKLLKPLAKDEDRTPFATIGFMALVLIIHALVLLISLKEYYGISFLPKMNKFVFGGVTSTLFFTVNYFLFEKNDRYIDLMKRIREVKLYKKITALIIILTYLLFPLLIIVLN